MSKFFKTANILKDPDYYPNAFIYGAAGLASGLTYNIINNIKRNHAVWPMIVGALLGGGTGYILDKSNKKR